MNDAPFSSRPRRRSRLLRIFLIAAGVSVLLLVLAYHYVTTGGLHARQTPSRWEGFIASKLVDLSIPPAVKALKNPFQTGPEGAAVAGGRSRYQKDCETCHGFDGNGNTSAGSGVYPPPLRLSRAALDKAEAHGR